MARLRLFVPGLGASVLSASCFVTPSTLGNPCVVDEDCGAGLVCRAEICELDEGESTTTTTDDPADTGDTAVDPETSAGEETDGGSSDSTGIAAEGEFRFVHGSADLGAVDLYVQGAEAPWVEDLDYGDASEWLGTAEGSYVFELRAAGSAPSDAPIFTGAPVTLGEGDRISTLAVGLTAGGEDDALRLLPLREDWGTGLADRARARIVHAGADAPTITIDGLEGPPFDLQRFDDSAAIGVPLDTAGGERIQLLDASGVLTTFTTPPLSEGDEVLVVATGLFDSLAREPDGFSLFLVGAEGSLGQVRQDPQLFTLHGARDAGNLENCTNGFEVATNFNYGEVQSSFISPGEYDFEIYGYPSGCTGAALNPGGNASGPLEAGERYLLLLTGEQSPDGGEPAIQVAPFRDRFPTDAAGTTIRFIHGASAEQIYVGNVSDGLVPAADVYTNPIAWRSESQPVSLAEQSYLLGIADAVGKPRPPLNPLVTFDYAATGSSRQWGIVSGDPSPEEGDGVIQLMLLDTTGSDWTVQLVDINQ
ncbi:MAG: DUF4397 domain-containing protein [Myxococcota bacterium]